MAISINFKNPKHFSKYLSIINKNTMIISSYRYLIFFLSTPRKNYEKSSITFISIKTIKKLKK